MMGRQRGDQSQLFYVFNLEERIPDRHLLRRINPIVTGVLQETSRKAEALLQRDRPAFDRSRAHAADADRRVLLRRPLRAQAVRGGRASPGLSLVLPPGS